MMEIMLEIVFVRRNLFRINCEWKYFLENLFVKLKHGTWTWKRSYCWCDRQKLWMKTLWGKSLSNWNMEKIAMAIMNGNTGNSFCKLKRNYCWINCKVKETTHEKEATIKEIVNKHLIVETFSGKSLSNRNMEKNWKENFAKVKLLMNWSSKTIFKNRSSSSWQK